MNHYPTIPIPVRRALLTLGKDIGNARRRRHIQAEVMAERASISRTTLYKLERGDPAVGMGTYATVLYVLGMLDRLAVVAALTHDEVGLSLEEERLPKRIRHAETSRSKSHRAARAGIPPREISRMASAFDHADLTQALKLAAAH